MSAHGKMNVAASVHQRLLNIARAGSRPFNELLVLYAMERFLFRLASSEYADRFVLKGALAQLVWQSPVTRPTRDIDLLGSTSDGLDEIRAIIADICRSPVEEDGLAFDPSGVMTQRIAEDADYAGVRATFEARLGNGRIAMQVDIGFSDVVTPEPLMADYPVLLGHPAPRIRTYSRETAIAEKLEAMVTLGELNTRMKDFFDVQLLAKNFDFDGNSLSRAIEQTFRNRKTPIQSRPACFTDSFGVNPMKDIQWKSFLRKSKVEAAAPTHFRDVVADISAFAQPVFEAIAMGRFLEKVWTHPGPWR